MPTRTTFAITCVFLPALVLAAPVPTDNEKPKPRPRLIGTVSLPVQVEEIVWLPDGKHLILRCNDGLARVIRRDQFSDDDPAGKPVAEFKLPTRSQHLAISPDGSELYAVVTAGGKLTAESRAYFWNVKRVLEGKDMAKADRIVSLETDATGLGVLAGNGRHYIIPMIEPRRMGQPNNPNQWNGQSQEYTARFDRLSAKTGDRIDELVKFDDGDVSYAAHTVDAKANRLFVQLVGSDETTVLCIDLTTGKQAWERKLPGQTQKGMTGAPIPSADGGLLAVMQSQLVPVGVAQPNGRAGAPPQVRLANRTLPVLLNCKTGEPVNLTIEEISHAQLLGFSSDGRLLVGQVQKDSGASQTVVWDTATGKPVKAWNSGGRGDAKFSFAPGGHELFVIERERKDVYGPTNAVPQGFSGNGGQQWTTQREVIRSEYKSTLGVWDLAPLVK